MGRALSVIGVPTSAANFTAALEGLTSLNEQLLRDNPQTPPLYAAGVRYTKRASDRWRNVNDAIASGDGDCEALAPWRAAELRVSGEDPWAAVMCYRTGPKKFHAVVQRGDGQIEDPSVALGMKAPPGLVDTYHRWNDAVLASQMGLLDDGGAGEVAVMGADSDDVACIGIGPDVEDGADAITFDPEVRDHGNGKRSYRGHARIPLAGGRALYVQTSSAATPESAERKASAVIGLVGSLWDDLAFVVAPFPEAAATLRIARNQHVQNLAKAAYNAARGGFHGGAPRGQGGQQGGQRGGQMYREQTAGPPAATTQPQATAPGWMPPMGAPTGADLSDPAYYDDMAQMGTDFGPADASQLGAGYYPPPSMGFRNDDVYDQLMAARAADDLDSGIYGFGPTPAEDECIGAINEVLAAGSRPEVGVAFGQTYVQQGGANFRTQQRAPAPTHSTTLTPVSRLPLGSSAAAPGSGWSTVPGSDVPGAVPPGVPGMAPYAGPIYSSAMGTYVPAGTNLRGYYGQGGPAAPPPGYYPGAYGGGISSTGVPYGAAAARYGYSGGGGGSGDGGSYGGSGGGSSYDDYGSGAQTIDPDAFFGSNPSGLSFEDKAAMLEAYGASD